MTDAVHQVDMILDFIEQQEQHGCVSADLTGYAAQRLEYYCENAHRGVTLDDAFGVSCAPGARPWWMQKRRLQWVALLQSTAAAHFEGQAPRHQAAALEQALRVYRRRRWKADQAAGRCPHAHGTLDAALFELMTVGPEFGSSVLTIQRALEGSES